MVFAVWVSGFGMLINCGFGRVFLRVWMGCVDLTSESLAV
jgi:hypothetical protein